MFNVSQNLPPSYEDVTNRGDQSNSRSPNESQRSRFTENMMLVSVRSNLRNYLKQHSAQLNELQYCQYGALNGRQITPLHLAVDINDLELVTYLLANGAKIDVKMSNGNTALIHSIYYKMEAMLDLLISKGAKTGADSEALHIACETGWPEGVNKLLTSHVNVDNLRKGINETALHVIVKSKQKIEVKDDIMNLLMTSKCDSTIRDKNGLGAVHYAARLQDEEGREGELARKFVMKLVDYDRANVNLQTSLEYCTPLHQAVSSRNYNLVLSLLAKGADKDIKGQVTQQLLPPAKRESSYDYGDGNIYKCRCSTIFLYMTCCIAIPFRIWCDPDNDVYPHDCADVDLFFKTKLNPCCGNKSEYYAKDTEIENLLKKPDQSVKGEFLTLLGNMSEPEMQTIARGDSVIW